MAFKDLTKVLYDGSIKLDYKDKAHRYYVRTRENWDLPEDHKDAWSKIIYPAGTTTLLGDTLEKKGLMTWPLGLAMRELFGFYDFTNDEGQKMTGFSKDIGTMWTAPNSGNIDFTGNEDRIIELVTSANRAWQRTQKKGADIGSVVHDAIEHYVLAKPHNPEKIPVPFVFDIAENYNWLIKESEYESEAAEAKAWEQAPEEIEQAKIAFGKFCEWWDSTEPVLYGAEDLLYSKKHNVCGTYDGDLGIKREHHPVFKDDSNAAEVIRVTTDWKTSKASTSKDAASPEGVYYSYFIQLAIYELCRREMGFPPADDLLTVSARKDGGFSLVYASELGLTVQDCIDWAVAVILCYKLAKKTKKALLEHAPEGEK